MVFLARRWRKPSWRNWQLEWWYFYRDGEWSPTVVCSVFTGESGRCGLGEDQSWTESWQMVTGERESHTPSADGRMVNINNKEHQQYTISTPAMSSLIPTLLHHLIVSAILTLGLWPGNVQCSGEIKNQPGLSSGPGEGSERKQMASSLGVIQL